MKSRLAGIVDVHGGFRVVVGSFRSILCNWLPVMHPHDRLFILPGVWVDEPVAWHDIPWTIRRVELYIEEWLRGRNYLDIAMQRYCERKQNPSDSLHIAGLLT